MPWRWPGWGRAYDREEWSITHTYQWASAAIPGVFPPVLWGSRVLVDGGSVNDTPFSQAVALGADRIIVLPALGAAPLRSAPRIMPTDCGHAEALVSEGLWRWREVLGGDRIG